MLKKFLHMLPMVHNNEHHCMTKNIYICLALIIAIIKWLSSSNLLERQIFFLSTETFSSKRKKKRSHRERPVKVFIKELCCVCSFFFSSYSRYVKRSHFIAKGPPSLYMYWLFKKHLLYDKYYIPLSIHCGQFSKESMKFDLQDFYGKSHVAQLLL